MNFNHQSTLVALLTTATLFCGCSNTTDDSSMELGIQGLTESKTIAACSEQHLSAVSQSSGNASAEFTWNVTAPQDASFVFEPSGTELRFVARTPGEYTISASDCLATQTADVDCTSTEFAITVGVGADLNENGIGDLCEAITCTPDCTGRACGLDPICNSSCGSCAGGQTCDEATNSCKAACVPACGGRTCGLDPICKTSCGTCGAGSSCDEEDGVCKAACVPACGGRTCGLDPICKTSCGTCGDGNSCNAEGQCQADAQPGRVVTIVMALTDMRLGFTDPFFTQRARLIEQSVLWVSRVDAPKVLVVLDDSSSDRAWEAQLIRSTLKRRGISATYIKEPSRGLSAEQLKGYDVVWFSSPEAAIDDKQTIQVLTAFAQHGGGLVLQGDDITQPTEMQPLTRLRNVDTGKNACGLYIDDDRGASYKVSIERTRHPVTADLRGNSYYYGDDIDASTLIPNAHANVLAWAQAGSGCHHDGRNAAKCEKQPVIVAYDMNDK